MYEVIEDDIEFFVEVDEVLLDVEEVVVDGLDEFEDKD